MRIFDAFRAGVSATRSFWSRVAGLLGQLFNEVVGFVFFAIALFFIFSANGVVQSAKMLDRDPDALGKLVLAGVFALMFVWFGYSNFRRARGISRRMSAED